MNKYDELFNNYVNRMSDVYGLPRDNHTARTLHRIYDDLGITHAMALVNFINDIYELGREIGPSDDEIMRRATIIGRRAEKKEAELG